MVAVALSTDHQPRRAHPRLRLGIPARLLTLEGGQWVTLVDLSISGACLELGGPAKVSGGLLGWLGFEAFGDAAWQVGDRLALHFDAPIDQGWVLATRQRAAVELAPDVAARRSAREWATGLVPD